MQVKRRARSLVCVLASRDEEPLAVRCSLAAGSSRRRKVGDTVEGWRVSDRARVDRLWVNARLATLDPASRGLGVIERGYLGCRNGRIACIGEGPPDGIDAMDVEDCGGRLILPGLIDCHTHLVHGGDRATEFEMRLSGSSYEAIAAGGGGILATVRATRGASDAELIATALPRLDALTAEGVTTVEIKSGYGLDFRSEARMLRAARALGQRRVVRVVTTFLGAHAVPPEAGGDRHAYIEEICRTTLPALAADRLVDAVDAFCETLAFSPSQCRMLFATAKRLNLPVKLHADQLTNGGGAALAAEAGALSADHLEFTDEAGASAMARAGTVAVLLPGAYYFLRGTQKPPIEAFRSRGVAMAVATDCNPGSAPLTSILLAMNMAATLFSLSVEECIAGVTRNAARALGLSKKVGTLEVGKRCDLTIWNVERPAELVYRIGFNPLHARVWGGR